MHLETFKNLTLQNYLANNSFFNWTQRQDKVLNEETSNFLLHDNNENEAEEVKCKKHDSEENQTIVVDNSCTICANPRNGFYAFLPCGHSIACEVCCAKIFAHARNSQNNKQTVCPCCCLPVTGYQQFYVQWKTSFEKNVWWNKN